MCYPALVGMLDHEKYEIFLSCKEYKTAILKRKQKHYSACI